MIYAHNMVEILVFGKSTNSRLYGLLYRVRSVINHSLERAEWYIG